MEKKLAVLSVSGGLDSTCLLLKLLSEGYQVQAYSFDYGQKHIIEQEKLKRNISFLQERNLPVKLQIIDLKDCFSDSQSSLCKEGENIPKGDYNEENMSSTVVENRNVIFASIIYGKALSLSKKEGNIPVDIFLGIHAGDHCLPYDTLVLTETGKKPINMLIPNEDKVLSFSEKKGLSYQLVTNLVCNGVREDVFRVTTRGGRSVIGTSNHKFYKVERFNFHQHTGWKKRIVEVPLSELNIGDFLITPYKLKKGDFHKKDVSRIDLLPYCNQNHFSFHFDEEKIWFREANKVNRFVEKDAFIKLLAWYITEGSVGSVSSTHSNAYRVGIPQSRSCNPEHCKEIEETISKWGFNVTECVHKKSNSSNFFFSGPTTYIFKECGDISFNKKIPSFLLGLDDELLLETLIKGDGCTKLPGTDFSYVTNSPILKEQVCSLALQLGYSVGVSEGSAGCYSVISRLTDKKKMNVIGDHQDSKICEIVSIEKCSPIEVWDITVENNHNFIAGNGSGLLVSNSLYPDTTPESREACEKAFKVSNNGSELISYQAPFVNINKSQVLKAGLEAMTDMGFSRESVMTVLKNTHSCYDPDEQGRACGKCGTCKERLQCFIDNGLEDPVEYQ